MNVYSADLGTHGHTFPIFEQNLIKYLQQKLAGLSEEESIQLQNKLQKKAIEALEQPKAIELPETTTYRCHFYDPTIVAQEEITDLDGQVIVQKGASYNPLKLVSFQTLLFFDGSNPMHVAWAREEQGKWILVKGKPLDLESEENRPIYFDQFGCLTEKLGIQSIPTKVSQQGLFLKLEEIPLETR